MCRWRLALVLHLWASEDTNGTDYAFLLNLIAGNALVFFTPCLANLRPRSELCYPLQQAFTRLMSCLQTLALCINTSLDWQ